MNHHYWITASDLRYKFCMSRKFTPDLLIIVLSTGPVTIADILLSRQAFIAVFKHLITNEELFLHGIPIFTGLTKFTFWQYITLPSHFLISS